MGKRVMLSDAIYDESSVWIGLICFRDLDDVCPKSDAKVPEHSL